MYRRLEEKLLPLDIELERTLRNLKKVGVFELVAMAEQERTDQDIPANPTTKRPQIRRTMEDF